MNTPEFRSVLEWMLEIPVYEQCVEYYPSGLNLMSTDDYSAHNRALFCNDGVTNVGGITKLLTHIYDNRNRYSEDLVPIKPDDGAVFFALSASYGIAQQCPEKELAWEFLKFIATSISEYRDDVPEPVKLYSFYSAGWPVNKADSCYVLEERLDHAVYLSNGRYVFKGDDYQVVLVNIYNRLDEWNRQCSRAITYDYTLEAELMWPDYYQLLSGKQSVEMTLANLQSRLEIYLSE